MKKRAYVLSVLWVLLVPLPHELSAAFERGGGLGNGARPLGMGGAYVSVAEDLSTVYWNPAGLSAQRRMAFYSMYGSLYNNKRQNLFLTLGLPHPAGFCFAVSADNVIPDSENEFWEGSYLLTFALPGVPLIYNGQEAANTTRLPLFDRVAIDWTHPHDSDLRGLYANLSRLRHQRRSLRRGETRISSALAESGEPARNVDTPEEQVAAAGAAPDAIGVWKGLSDPNGVSDLTARPQDRPESTAGSAEVLYVTGTRVNVREGPSTDFGIVGTVAEGDAVELLSEAGGWAEIRFADSGETGFMSRRFLSEAQ